MIRTAKSAEKQPVDARRVECVSRHGQSCLMRDKNRNKPPPVLGPDVRKALGHALQAVYADIIAEGVPEQFAAILRKLDEPSNEGEAR